MTSAIIVSNGDSKNSLAILRIKTPHDLATIVRAKRQALGLNQSGLANRIGVSRKWVVDLEHGKPNVSLNLVLLTLNALELPLRIGEATTAGVAKVPAVDIDAIVNAARGKR